MPLETPVHEPTARSVLFHLTLFGEFCEAAEAVEASAALACESLRDAIEDVCRSSTSAVMTTHDQAALLTALRHSEAAFRKDMPDLYGRTGAARGFSALVDLVDVVAAPGHCFERERRSAALGVAQRFGKTLGAFIGSLKSNPMRHCPDMDELRHLARS